MIILELTKKPHDLKQLYSELLANGLNPELVEGNDETGLIRLGFPDDTPSSQLDLATQIVENHVPSPPSPPPPTPDEQLKMDLQAMTSPTANDIKTALLNWLANRGV